MLKVTCRGFTGHARPAVWDRPEVQEILTETFYEEATPEDEPVEEKEEVDPKTLSENHRKIRSLLKEWASGHRGEDSRRSSKAPTGPTTPPAPLSPYPKRYSIRGLTN